MGVTELEVPKAGTVEIVVYTKQELQDLLADQRFWIQPRLPITRRRIASQVSNPRADANDTVLITARHKGQLVAHIGVLPDLLVTESQKLLKFGWLTAWWADKECEHRLAAIMVLLAAMKKYPGRLAVSYPSNEAGRVYDGTRQFHECGRLKRSYFVMGLPSSLGALNRATTWFAGAKNRLIFVRDHRRRGLEVQIADAFDGAMESFVNSWASRDPLRRDSSYWNWVLKFPWISSDEEDKAIREHYAFSAFAKDFRQIPMFVIRFGTIIAFLVMTLRDGRLSLKYAHYELSDVHDIAVALRSIISKINPWLFVCGESRLETELRSGLPFYFARRRRSSTIYASTALQLVTARHLQLGTGDSIFT